MSERPSLLSFLVGRVTLRGESASIPAFLEICMRHALPHSAPVLHGDGSFSASMSPAAFRKCRSIAAASGIIFSECARDGLLVRFCGLFRRPGLLLGILLALALVRAASAHLWEIRVTGNETLSKREVERALSEAGLSVGGHIARFDVDAIENRLLLSSDRIAWITVNLIGNVAEVQIREKLPSVNEESLGPANLVAREDGVIVSCEVLRGNLLVKVGTPVRKGEVLVSGIYDSAVLGYRYTAAAGAIYAETEHTVSVTVPYTYETLVNTGRTHTRYGFFFFGKEFSFGEANDETADSVEISTLSVFGKELPIGFRKERFYETAARTFVYGEVRAVEIAYDRLMCEISAIPGMRGVLRKSTACDIGEDGVTLTCTVRCIENIAEVRPIEISFDGSGHLSER